MVVEADVEGTGIGSKSDQAPGAATVNTSTRATEDQVRGSRGRIHIEGVRALADHEPGQCLAGGEARSRCGHREHAAKVGAAHGQNSRGVDAISDPVIAGCVRASNNQGAAFGDADPACVGERSGDLQATDNHWRAAYNSRDRIRYNPAIDQRHPAVGVHPGENPFARIRLGHGNRPAAGAVTDHSGSRVGADIDAAESHVGRPGGGCRARDGAAQGESRRQGSGIVEEGIRARGRGRRILENHGRIDDFQARNSGVQSDGSSAA